MRALVLVLLAASVQAQPASGAWRVETSTPLVGRTPGDIGVRVERSVGHGLSLGVARTERRAAAAYVAASVPVGAVEPRASIGVTTHFGEAVPLVGLGLDVGLTPALGLSLGVEQTVTDTPETAIVRAGLQVTPDRVVPPGEAERLFPGGATGAAPHWRAALSGGLTGPFAGLVSLAAERTWRAPFAFGGRLWATTSSSNFQEDGGFLDAGGAEALVSVGTRGPWADLRASTGVGVAAIDYDSGSISLCDPFACSGSEGFEGVRPYAIARVGLDLYPHAAVGVGGAIHAALMEGPANVSAVEVGLRLRLGD